MEQELAAALRLQSTLYRRTRPALLAELAELAGRTGDDAKSLSAAFDKYMTVHRFGAKEVSADDVRVFSERHAASAAARRAPVSTPPPAGRPATPAATPVAQAAASLALDLMPEGIGGGAAPTSATRKAAISPSPKLTPRFVRGEEGTGGLGAGGDGGGDAAALPARAESGSVLAALAGPRAGAAAAGPGAPRATATGPAAVRLVGPHLRPGARYMADRLGSRAGWLERRVREAELRLLAWAQEGAEDASARRRESFGASASREGPRAGVAPSAPPRPPCLPCGSVSPGVAVFAGRVVADSETGRPNERSLALEGSCAWAAGGRARLDLARCPRLRLFPGMVAVVMGASPMGGEILVDEATCAGGPADDEERGRGGPGDAGDARSAAPARGWALPQPFAALPAPPPPPGPATVMVAAGPFTHSGDLTFAPLRALLAEAAEARPDVLLLCGPFLPDSHARVLDGSLLEAHEELVAREVGARIEELVARTRGAVAVACLPSPADLLADPVYPAPPCPSAWRGAPNAEGAAARGGAPAGRGGGTPGAVPAPGPSPDRRESAAGAAVMTLPSPATFSFSPAGTSAPPLVVTASAPDWPLAASAVEVARSPPGDRLSSLAEATLQQRCLFPRFPPPEGLPLDASLAAEGGVQPPTRPHLLVLPSDLAPFIRVLHGAGGAQTIAINPGRAARGASGFGSYCRLSLAAGVEPVGDRARVEIVRI